MLERLDLGDPESDLAAKAGSLPRFLLAEPLRKRLLLLSSLFAAMSFAFWLFTMNAAEGLWRTVLASDAAASVLLVAGLLSGYWVVRWRALATGSPEAPKPPAKRRRRPSKPSDAESLAELKAHIEKRARRLGSFALAKLGEQGVESCIMVGLCLIAIALVRHYWIGIPDGASLGTPGVIGGAVLGLIAFGILVLERDFAGYPDIEWPEAIEYSRASRILVATLMLSSAAVLLDSPSSRWAPRIALLSDVLPVLLAGEWLLRTLISLFSSRDPQLEPVLLGRTTVGALITWPPPTLDSLQNALQQRFGIDLRQNWAFSFVRRASLPVLIGILIVGWLLTGVSELAADRRGVYEVFGRPTAVVGPGLHAGLPWPFSRMRSVENGVVHEIATALPTEGNMGNDTSRAEDPAPATANRLWDASHAAEQVLLIASANKDTQGFQIVNMDVRFFYRIALTPLGAMNSVYQTTDLPALIRSIASRAVIDVFASRTLDGVLVEERRELSRTIGTAVQAQLDDLQSGVEILATVVEAIHPPAGAADAYHSVQAAQITSEASISRERGQAAVTTNLARQEASRVENEAEATGRETLSLARAVESRFTAEQRAIRTGGNAFVFEYYLSQLSLGLSGGRMTIVDHRIGGTGAPTIDLRRFGASSYIQTPP